MRLKEKVAIVTGAASGIGKAIAHRFATEGALVIIADKNESAIPPVVEEIKVAGGQAAGFAVDVVDRAQIQGFISKVVETHSRIDVLVNNAGITRYRPFLCRLRRRLGFSAECRFERRLLLRSGGSPPHDPASLWKDRQYLLRSRHRHDASQHRRIPGGKLGLRFGQSRGHSTHEDAGARTRPPWDQCELCCPGTFLTPLTASTRTPEEVAEHIAFRTKTVVLNRLGQRKNSPTRYYSWRWTKQVILQAILYMWMAAASIVCDGVHHLV